MKFINHIIYLNTYFKKMHVELNFWHKEKIQIEFYNSIIHVLAHEDIPTLEDRIKWSVIAPVCRIFRNVIAARAAHYARVLGMAQVSGVMSPLVTPFSSKVETRDKILNQSIISPKGAKVAFLENSVYIKSYPKVHTSISISISISIKTDR